MVFSSKISALLNGLGTALSASVIGPIVLELPAYVPLVALSGLCGGLARWVVERSNIWPNGLATMVSGVLVAVFLWPVGQPMAEGLIGKLDLEPATALMFGGFLTGLLGISLIAAVLDIFASRKSRIEGGANDD